MGRVVELKQRPEGHVDQALPIKKRDKFCSHINVEVDQDEKELRCIQCNAVVYAFDYVMSLATGERSLFQHMDFVRKEVEKLKEEQISLSREVERLKAAKRRYSKL